MLPQKVKLYVHFIWCGPLLNRETTYFCYHNKIIRGSRRKNFDHAFSFSLNNITRTIARKLKEHFYGRKKYNFIYLIVFSHNSVDIFRRFSAVREHFALNIGLISIEYPLLRQRVAFYTKVAQ